jgi:hypothetical protein
MPIRAQEIPGVKMKDVFLCHAAPDKDWVRELGARLEAETVGNRHIEVFFDEWDVDHGENIVAKIDEGLRVARLCAVVLSPSMLKRAWPEAEWTARFVADPAGRHKQLLPILLHERDPATGEPIDIPLLLRPLRRFDFTKPSRYDREFQELLRRVRGEPPRRGGWRQATNPIPSDQAGAEAPDDVQEVIVSNLLPVELFPETISSDVATTAKKTEIWGKLKGKNVPPFLLHQGRLYSFFSPDSYANPFKEFLTGVSPKSEGVREWLTDPDRSKHIVRLFNEALQEHAYHLRIRNFKDNRKQYFCPVFDGRPRHFAWGGGGRLRTIAKLASRPDGSTIGIHYSAKMRFLALGARMFLLVEPGWMFSSDGMTPLEGKQVTILSTKFGGKERNAAVLRNVLMWSMLLADGQERIRIPVGGGNIVVDPVPALANVPVGIDGDAMNLERIFADELGGELAPGEDAAEEELERGLTLAATAVLPDDADLDLDEEYEE